MLLVVLFHGNAMVAARYGLPPWSGFFSFGFSGVHLFFVLSGFIILSAHRPDIGRPGRLPYYLGRRFVRIYPLYWLAFLAWGGWRLFAGRMALGEFLPNALWFSPGTGAKLVIPVSWTLLYEISFYGLFCLLILNRRLGIAAMAAWMAAVAWRYGQPGHYLLHPFNLLFGFGLMAALGFAGLRGRARRLRNALGLASLVLGGLIFAGAARYYVSLDLDATAWPDHPVTILGFGLASALLLLSATAEPVERFFAGFRFASLLGNASYSIYLVHLQIERMAVDMTKGLAWVWQGAQSPAVADALLLWIAVAAVALGILAHLWIERPLLALLRRGLARPSAKASIAAQGQETAP